MQFPVFALVKNTENNWGVNHQFLADLFAVPQERGRFAEIRAGHGTVGARRGRVGVLANRGLAAVANALVRCLGIDNVQELQVRILSGTLESPAAVAARHSP